VDEAFQYGVGGDVACLVGGDRAEPDQLARLVVGAERGGEGHQDLHEGFAGVHRPRR
jgi:hypothetical protein